ncbi:hypothetical protein LX32DRAFT_689115 [Colletotrichum zoysiae]|uniref:Uncharacterized protein n=1 Tax=Colletotrichum zoysiae TaxID=1216348 RepID=A0AAD9HVQ1_9PEZI|nr:hypothetical protein LX32DRAFT_689115 [Colletotrichum zoysiae]
MQNQRKFNNVKEMIIYDLAEHFHGAGFTILSIDPRSIGASVGTPRNEYNTTKNIEDYHDALTFLKTQPCSPETVTTSHSVRYRH